MISVGDTRGQCVNTAGSNPFSSSDLSSDWDARATPGWLAHAAEEERASDAAADGVEGTPHKELSKEDKQADEMPLPAASNPHNPHNPHNPSGLATPQLQDEHALAHRAPTDVHMSPALLAQWSLAVGLHRVKADSDGTRDGNWVPDSAIHHILEPLTLPEAQHFTHNHEAFELNVCYLEAGQVQIPDMRSKLPRANLLLLVTHIVSETEGLHFSAMVLNVRCKVLHVFDTLGRQAGECAYFFA